MMEAAVGIPLDVRIAEPTLSQDATPSAYLTDSGTCGVGCTHESVKLDGCSNVCVLAESMRARDGSAGEWGRATGGEKQV